MPFMSLTYAIGGTSIFIINKAPLRGILREQPRMTGRIRIARLKGIMRIQPRLKGKIRVEA